jgi:FdrA protein
MQLQRSLAGLTEVLDAGVVMATPANQELLAASDLLPDDLEGVRSDDLLIVVRAESDEAAAEALGQVDELLSSRKIGGTGDFRPRSLNGALRQLPEARWVLVSVSGRWATGVAREALAAGRHVFLYSDNVSVRSEVELKRFAVEQGLMVMGPDCGTAMIAGVGMGFANRVARGPIGVIGASGTGLQAVTSRIHALGMGVSQALGTGSRDLSQQIGGVSALQALDLLRRDDETRVVVLVSKPPDPKVATRVLAAAQEIGKPVVVDFLGAPAPGRRLGNLLFARSLEETADLAVELLASQVVQGRSPVSQSSSGFVRGLFSGGTLAQEALLRLGAFLQPIHSNWGAGSAGPSAAAAELQGHTLLDLGADELTVGRPHPMLDYDLRLRRLKQEAEDPSVGLILLDVVLGEGAHPDPAAELAPEVRAALKQARAEQRDLEIAVVLVGTDEDPQDLEAQRRALSEAGASVFTSLRELTEIAALRFGKQPLVETPEVSLAALEAPLAAVNVGLESFYLSLVAQGAKAVQVDWRPPAGGDEALGRILDAMKPGAKS